MKVTDSVQGKKILYVITKANWGGAQRYVYDMALAARTAGYDVTVAYGEPGKMAERLKEDGITTLPLRSMGRDIHAASDFSTFLELQRIMRALKPSIVHSNSSKAGALAALAAQTTGVPRSIFTAHGWAFNEKRPGWQKLLIALSHYVTVLLSDETICVSAALKRDAKWMPFVQRRLHVIHNGVAAIPFLSREEARARLLPNIDARLWLGTIAELHPTKQLSVAIEAFAKIAKEFPESIYVIMGEGQERVNLEKLIADRGLSSHVYLCGHVEDAATYLKAFDVFCLPSRSEGLGYVVLEAGSAKLPVVASRVGGIPEIITSESFGILVPPADPRALATSFSELLTDQTKRSELGATLHDRVAHEFSIEKMARDTLQLYAN